MSQQREMLQVPPRLFITSFHFLLTVFIYSRYGNTLLPPPDYKQSEGMLHALLMCIPQHLSDKRYLTNSPIFMNTLMRNGFWTLWVSFTIFKKHCPVIDCVSCFSSPGLGFPICKVRGPASVPPASVAQEPAVPASPGSLLGMQTLRPQPTYWIRICI